MVRALALITRGIKHYTGGIKLITDSRYVIQTIRGNNKTVADGIKARHLANNLNNYSNVTLCWVPGHQNIEGNERADSLAKKAAGLKLNPTYGRVPITHINTYILKKCKEAWQSEWEVSTTGRTTYRFLPSIHRRILLHHLHPTFELSQCLTGHGNLPAYLHRFKKLPSPYCHCDNTSIGDVFHYVFDCPDFDLQRGPLWMHCTLNGQPWPPPADFLCETKETFTVFNNFINSCTIFRGSSQGCPPTGTPLPATGPS
ncbi:uncharacterized protein LOC111614534 [Centruroides sculpturatus]|nr:uncharacterized protein LOC111614534 [Centruroides sculpturatus]